MPRHYSQTQNQDWQEKDLPSTLTFHSEIALKELGNLGDIFSWEDLAGALVRTTKLRLGTVVHVFSLCTNRVEPDGPL